MFAKREDWFGAFEATIPGQYLVDLRVRSFNPKSR